MLVVSPVFSGADPRPSVSEAAVTLSPPRRRSSLTQQYIIHFPTHPCSDPALCEGCRCRGSAAIGARGAARRRRDRASPRRLPSGPRRLPRHPFARTSDNRCANSRAPSPPHASSCSVVLSNGRARAATLRPAHARENNAPMLFCGARIEVRHGSTAMLLRRGAKKRE